VVLLIEAARVPRVFVGGWLVERSRELPSFPLQETAVLILKVASRKKPRVAKFPVAGNHCSHFKNGHPFTCQCQPLKSKAPLEEEGFAPHRSVWEKPR